MNKKITEKIVLYVLATLTLEAGLPGYLLAHHQHAISQSLLPELVKIGHMISEQVRKKIPDPGFTRELP